MMAPLRLRAGIGMHEPLMWIVLILGLLALCGVTLGAPKWMQVTIIALLVIDVAFVVTSYLRR